MSADKQKVLNILEMRYDYQSSRNVLSNWRKAAGIREDSDTLNDEALKSLLAYLKDNAADAVRVHAAVERMILSNDTHEAVEAPVEVVETVVEAPAEVVEAPAEVVETVEMPAEETVEAVEETAEETAEAADAPAEETEAPAEAGKKKKKSKK